MAFISLIALAKVILLPPILDRKAQLS